MCSLKILFLDILTDDPKIRQEDNQMLMEYSGYGGLMQRCIGRGHKLDVMDAGLCPLPDLDSLCVNIEPNWWDGIIIGGSVKDIGPQNHIEHWQAQTFRLIARAVELQIPVLGICGGHQYGARALVGSCRTVIKNPLGPNRGTSNILFTNGSSHHPVFNGCSSSSLFQWSHVFVVDKLPADAVRLAAHPKTINAAFQCGSFIGVQFHPEFGALRESGYGTKLMREILKLHLDEAETDEEKYQLELALDYDLRPAPDSGKIFANWIKMIQERFFK